MYSPVRFGLNFWDRRTGSTGFPVGPGATGLENVFQPMLGDNYWTELTKSNWLPRFMSCSIRRIS